MWLLSPFLPPACGGVRAAVAYVANDGGNLGREEFHHHLPGAVHDDGAGSDRAAVEGFGGEVGLIPPPLRGGSTGVSRSGWGVFKHRRISSTTPVRFRSTSEFQYRRTRKPRDCGNWSRSLSEQMLSGMPCWPPSISTTIRLLSEAKSTMYGPIGTCRRKRKPKDFNSRSFIHTFTSCSVRRFRSARAVSLANLIFPDRHPTGLRPVTLPARGRDEHRGCCAAWQRPFSNLNMRGHDQ